MSNLKYFRKKAVKTQKEIADLLNITQTAYGNYELGKRQIHVSPEDIHNGTFHVLGRVLIPIPQAL